MIANSVKQEVLKDGNRWKPTREIVNSYAVSIKINIFGTHVHVHTINMN
jgi:hypothetical protein